MQGGDRRQPKIVFIIRLGVSAGILIYLVCILDWDKTIDALNQANLLLFILSPCLFIVGYVLASVRWKIILSKNGIQFSFCKTLTTYFVGAFYNFLLPGVIAGDSVRIWRCAEQSRASFSNVTASVVLERTIGMIASLCIVYFANRILIEILPNLATEIKLVTYITVSIITILFLIMLIFWLRRPIREFILTRSKGPVLKFVSNGLETILKTPFEVLVFAFALSLAFQLTDIAVTYLLAHAVGIALPFIYFLATVPIVYLVTILPVSLGGLGVREGTFVFLLSKFDVAPTDAIILSFLVYFVRMSVGSLGGLIELKEIIIGKTSGKYRADEGGRANTK
jgi:uncharacterized protein (TIRG00374 family)